jgi:hypothetical protein
MKVSGFTIARNVVRADYPLEEAIRSIEPLCHEIIVAVGKSDDNTREFVQSLNIDKLIIIDTVWDDSLREGGKVLADETNKALKACSADSDWLFYIQADECIHEKDYEKIVSAMSENLENKNIEGLLFKYRHFYGSYDYLGDSRRWYNNEIRIIRNNSNIKSWKDAQGFRNLDNTKLKVVPTNAYIYHYGWVKHPKEQQIKQLQFHKLWHNDDYVAAKIATGEEFDYSMVDSLHQFKDEHPKIMVNRIQRMNWSFDIDPTKKNFGLKNRFLYWFEKVFNIRIGEYKNYILIKR